MRDIDSAIRRRLDRRNRRPFHIGRQLTPRASRRVGLREVVSRLTPLLRNGRDDSEGGDDERQRAAFHDSDCSKARIRSAAVMRFQVSFTPNVTVAAPEGADIATPRSANRFATSAALIPLNVTRVKLVPFGIRSIAILGCFDIAE